MVAAALHDISPRDSGVPTSMGGAEEPPQVEEGPQTPEFFSHAIKHNRYLAAWSPDGRYFAAVLRNMLSIRDRMTMQIVVQYSCVDTVDHLDWAPHSNMILCASFKRATVEVCDKNWHCRITEGLAGVTSAQWAPDSRHILTLTEFSLALTVWPLNKPGQSYVIKKPKSELPFVFSEDGRTLAVATRIDCKDHVAVYSTRDWSPLRCFQVETVDLVSIQWSRDGSAIAVQDTNLVYGVYVYRPDGKQVFKLQAYQDALGVKSMAWSPHGQFLAVGSYDQRCRVVSTLTWTVVAEFEHVHPKQLPVSTRARDMSCYTEEDADYAPRAPATIPSVKPDPNKPNPKLGVGLLSWSPDSRFLLTRNDNMPCVLFIWDVTDLGLTSLLTQREPVRSARWSPMNQLAIVTGGPRFYLWGPQEGPSWYDVPLQAGSFDVTRVRYSPDGQILALMSADHICMCALPN